MNLLEAIKEAKDTEMWFRPVSWKGTKEVLTISEDGKWTQIVPSDDPFGEDFMTSSVASLLGEWELVTPEEVCNE